ncbi:MAG: ACT domain-containing protein [Alphaproteobacteria bacterium]|nr:ACT domain-containing protein [Alphaproteobacteria bacterium]
MNQQPSQSAARPAPPPGNRAIVTIIGPDRVGIIAGIANVLAEANANIIDISQSVLREFFAMIMVVDLERATIPFDALRERLQTKGRELAVQVSIQREDIFKVMHRI